MGAPDRREADDGGSSRLVMLVARGASLLTNAAVWLYVAARANATLMVLLDRRESSGTSELYTIRLVDTLSIIVLLMGWLSATLWLGARVRAARTLRDIRRVAAQHLGPALLAFATIDAVYLSGTRTPLRAVDVAISGLLWAGGIGLLVLGLAGRRRK